MAERNLSDSIFWVETERIKPNPFQPRKTFDEQSLQSLAESIRQYGVLQPLTVTRKEIERPGEGISVEYELIAGERRLRASKIAGLLNVPVVIRTSEDSDRMKLELAIIENLQREDLNPLDRAKAFRRLADEFSMQHKEIGLRVGKSREYVSNTLRILALPELMQQALASGEISEGHTRPLLMLIEKPEEQKTLFKEIIARRLTVRDTEQLARRAAVERVRHTSLVSPDLLELEKKLSERLGTRVRIEKKDTGGKLMIDFFSPEDLTQLCMTLAAPTAQSPLGGAGGTGDKVMSASGEIAEARSESISDQLAASDKAEENAAVAALEAEEAQKESSQKSAAEADLYSIRNFTL